MQLKLSGLEAVLSGVAEVTCLDGPHPARGEPTPEVRRFFTPPFFEWWDAVESPGGAWRYEGAEESLDALERALREAAEGGRPVSGLLGFSQGAALAALALALQERGERFQDLPPLRCALLISGSRSRDPRHAHLYGPGRSGGRSGGHSHGSGSGSSGPDTPAEAQAAEAGEPQPAPPLPPPPLGRPSCHLVGAADPMRGRSEALAAAFDRPLIVRHAQGHVVPRLPPEEQQRVASFLAQHLQQPGSEAAAARSAPLTGGEPGVGPTRMR